MKINALLTFFISFMLAFTCFGAVSFSMTDFQKKVYPRKSFLSIEKRTTYFRCTKTFCKRVGSMGMAANGSVIKHSKNKTYILTAAHLVWLEPLSPMRRLMIYRPGAKVKVVIRYSAVDFSGNKYVGLKVVSYDKNTDLAILKLKRIKLPVIPIAKKAPNVGSALYNVSTPSGMGQPGIIPFFKGQFLGYYKYKSSKNRLALTNIPTAKGASGSPIVNSDGHLVGMISAVHRRFHHISFSPTHDQLVKFTKRVFKGEKVSLCLRPTSQPTSRPALKEKNEFAAPNFDSE